MLGKIHGQLKQANSGALSSDSWDPPFVASLIFHSLAARYTEVLHSIERITGKRLRRLFIVGGGSRNRLLNRLTAERTGLEVIAGATEGTTIGNFAIQMAALAGDWNETTGVFASSVSKYVEKITTGSMALSAERGT
jgi:rhamnulokinase